MTDSPVLWTSEAAAAATARPHGGVLARLGSVHRFADAPPGRSVRGSEGAELRRARLRRRCARHGRRRGGRIASAGWSCTGCAAAARRGDVPSAAGSGPGGACALDSEHRRGYRQRRQDGRQGGSQPGPRAAGRHARERRKLQQSLGSAAQPRANGSLGAIRGVRDGDEPRGRDRAANPPGPPARLRHHDGRKRCTWRTSPRSRQSPMPRRRFSSASPRTARPFSTATIDFSSGSGDGRWRPASVISSPSAGPRRPTFVLTGRRKTRRAPRSWPMRTVTRLTYRIGAAGSHWVDEFALRPRHRSGAGRGCRRGGRRSRRSAGA